MTWPDIKRIQAAESYLIRKRGFGFMDGGCWMFAKAIQLLIPGAQIVTIMCNRQPDHYGVRLENGLWGDARGMHESQYFWAQRYSIEERAFGRLEVLEGDMVNNQIPKDDNMVQTIFRILAKTG
jgi:hypothetical protein